MNHECEATQRGGQKCKAEAKWITSLYTKDVRLCDHHAALARRLWNPKRIGPCDEAPGPSREVVPEPPVEWEDDFCRSGNCRGRTKDRTGFPIRVRKGTPRTGLYRYCNECFCR